jgi:hypothetical protein
MLRGAHKDILIIPRWPSKEVHIEENALRKLERAQSYLPKGVCLIVTRGYEAPATQVGIARKLFRGLGVRLFMLLYPRRMNEIGEIFGSNGHDQDGTHIDISIQINGRRIRFLPFGVFTPLWLQEWKVKQQLLQLTQARDVLKREGFDIHSNPTESLQIHCDLPDPTQATGGNVKP